MGACVHVAVAGGSLCRQSHGLDRLRALQPHGLDLITELPSSWVLSETC